MAALFTAASTQYLTSSAPLVVDYPLVVGMWVRMVSTSATARILWSLSDTGTTNNYLMLRKNASHGILIGSQAGGTESAVGNAAAITATAWAFVLARFIASNNRRLALLPGDGNFATTDTSVARAPTGMDTMTLGALQTSGGVTEPWDGLIGEYWLANADIQSTNLTTQDALTRQLAFGGPFSVPTIAKDIIEYRSFRKAPVNDADEIGEVFHGALGRQTWVNTNGVKTLQPEHPPLPYWFARPNQNIRNLTV